jgi:hypothetical protein
VKLRTYAWTTESPGAIEQAELTIPDTEVPGYADRLDAAAREQGFSFATYRTDVLVHPEGWPLVRWYAADLGHGGTRCEHASAC